MISSCDKLEILCQLPSSSQEEILNRIPFPPCIVLVVGPTPKFLHMLKPYQILFYMKHESERIVDICCSRKLILKSFFNSHIMRVRRRKSACRWIQTPPRFPWDETPHYSHNPYVPAKDTTLVQKMYPKCAPSYRQNHH